MYQSNLKNQINPKTNYKISYQKISMKHLEQIMFNQISNLISIPIEKNFMLKQHNKSKLLTQNRTQNRKIKSKLKHVSKIILKTKLIQKKTNKISYQKISMKHLEQIMFNQISSLISIPIEKKFMLKQHNK